LLDASGWSAEQRHAADVVFAADVTLADPDMVQVKRLKALGKRKEAAKYHKRPHALQRRATLAHPDSPFNRGSVWALSGRF
jgi:hypothetical protein